MRWLRVKKLMVVVAVIFGVHYVSATAASADPTRGAGGLLHTPPRMSGPKDLTIREDRLMAIIRPNCPHGCPEPPFPFPLPLPLPLPEFPPSPSPPDPWA